MTARLAEVIDPVLGPLRWNEDGLSWEGQAEVRGKPVLLTVDPGLNDPNEDDQRAILEASRGLLLPALAAESRLLDQAVEQIAEDVADQGPFPKEEFQHALRLVEISLHAGGELHYDCGSHFGPGAILTIFFSEALEFGEAEIYHPSPPA